MNKKNINIIFLVIMFLGLSISSVTQGEPTLLSNNENKDKLSSPDQVTNATVPGTNIVYSYGTRQFKASDNFTALEEGSVSESIKEEHIHEVHITTERESGNTFEIRRWNNVTFWDKVNQMNITIPGVVVRNITRVVEEYDLTEAKMVDINTNQTIGRFTVNVTYAEITVNHLLDDTKDANITWVIYPDTIRVDFDYYDPGENLELNITLSIESVVQYRSYYSVAYNVSVDEWFAWIRDGNRMGLGVSAFKNLNMNYTEVRHSALWYSHTGFFNVTVKWQNGTEVPWTQLPFSLRPSFSNTHGTISELDFRVVQMKAISTTNSLLSVFHARYKKNLDNVAVQAESLAAWMIRSTPRLIAYKDGNLDHQLNLQFSPDEGIYPSDGDTVPFVGVTEAYGGFVGHRNIFNHTFNETKISFSGFTLNNDTRQNVNQIRDRETAYWIGLGNPHLSVELLPYWNDPTVDASTGTVKFDFGIEYRNFPVSWYSTTSLDDRAPPIIPMNITNAYIYEINPRTGQADLSPTVTYGEIIQPEAKAALNGLGLATIYRSDYMSIFALKADRTRQTKENVESSRAGLFTDISFSGTDNEFSTINHRGDKQFYELGSSGDKHQTNVSVLNLFAVSASAVGANVTVFESENDNIAGSAYLERTQVGKLDFKYRKDLILVSYPAWGGEKIVHDPTYSTAYVESPQSDPSSSTSASVQTSSEPVTTGAPGFELTAVIFSIFTIGLIVMNRRRK
ncbi:MAG: hypothetical protein ACW981_09725 [Candidatus Hodarchaeales archaeon]